MITYGKICVSFILVVKNPNHDLTTTFGTAEARLLCKCDELALGSRSFYGPNKRYLPFQWKRKHDLYLLIFDRNTFRVTIALRLYPFGIIKTH